MEKQIQNYSITDSQLKILRQSGIIPEDCPAEQVALFSELCKQHELNPFKKEIFLMPFKNKKIIGGQEVWQTSYQTIVGRDGLRVKAQRTGDLIGIDDAKFDIMSSGSFKTPIDYNENELPKSATITVYRFVKGEKRDFTSTVIFKEFSSGKQKWLTMPFQMIAKVAEVHALKKAFGGELVGLNIEEELPSFEDDTITGKSSILNTWEAKLEKILNIKDLISLYRENMEIVDNSDEIKLLFANRKKEII